MTPARSFAAASLPPDFDRGSANLRECAARHSMVVVVANYGGLPAAGKSTFWSDRGELLVRLDTVGAGAAIVDEDNGGWRTKAIMLGES